MKLRGYRDDKMKNNLEEKVKEMPENFSARKSRDNYGLIYGRGNDSISRGGSSNSSDYSFSRGCSSNESYSIDERSGSDYIL